MIKHNKDKRLAGYPLNGSPKVALEHYTQVIESDLQEAAKMSLLSEGEKEAQKPVQYDAARSRKLHLMNIKKVHFLPLNAALCGSSHERQISPRGVELNFRKS